MDAGRRGWLCQAGGLGVWGALFSCGLVPLAHAGERALFEADSLEAVLSALGATEHMADGMIEISVPDVAEDGRAVPFGVTSEVPGTEQVVLVVEKNPYIVAASVRFGAGVLPAVQTRLKMRESSRIYAIVRAGDGFHVAHREVKVIAGGCGV